MKYRSRSGKLYDTMRADRPLYATVAALAAGNDAALPELSATYGISEGRALAWVTRTSLPDLTGSKPFNLGLTLDTYQAIACSKLSAAGGLLAMEPGLGKTITALAAIEYTAAHLLPDTPKVIWVVAPLNALTTWKRIQPKLPPAWSMFLVSMDSLHKILDAVPDEAGYLVMDEVHLLASGVARRSKIAYKLRTKFTFGLGLTGTLTHGGIEKALNTLDLCIPGAYEFPTKWAAGAAYSCLVKKHIGPRTVSVLEEPTGRHKTAFMEHVARYTLIQTAETCPTAQIPGQTLQTIRFPTASRKLDDMIAEVAQDMLTENPDEVPHAQAIAQRMCAYGIVEKTAWLLEQLASDDEPVVVFCQYLESLDAIEIALTEAKISYVRVDGSVTGKDRSKAVDTFQSGEARVFLGQITAAGISVDLFRASVSVAVDHCWKAADYAQALRRTRRRGQQEECLHLDLVASPLQVQVVQSLRDASDFALDVALFSVDTHHIQI